MMILALHSWGDQRTPAEETRYRELKAKCGPESDPDFIDDYPAQLGRLAQLEPGDELNLDDPDLAGERIDVFVPELNAWVAVDCDGYGFTVEGMPEADEEETDADMIEWVEAAFRGMYRRPSQTFKDSQVFADAGSVQGATDPVARTTRPRSLMGRSQGSSRRTRRVANKSPGRSTSAGDGDPHEHDLASAEAVS